MSVSSSSRQPRSTWSRVDLKSASGPVRLTLFDHNLERSAEGIGELRKRLPSGVYLLQKSAGSWREESYLTLLPGTTFTDHELTMAFETAFPVGRRDEVEALHLRCVAEVSGSPARVDGSGGQFLFFVRSPNRCQQGAFSTDLGGLQLFDAEGKPVFTLADLATINRAEGWAGVSVELDPGGYSLRWPHKSESNWSKTSTRRAYDQSVWIQRGWITGLFTLAAHSDAMPQMTGMSVHMRDCAGGFDSEAHPDDLAENLAAELALGGLRSGEELLGVDRETLDRLLRGKFRDPMLGIIGAHVLLAEAKPRWSYFDTVVRHLFKQLPEMPDVVALRLIGKVRREIESRTRTDALAWPPMVYQGYAGLLRRDWDEESLVSPGSMVELAAPHLQHRGPWTAWRSFDATTEAPTTEPADAVRPDLPSEIADLAATFKSLSTEQVERLSEDLNAEEKRVAAFIRQRPAFDFEASGAVDSDVLKQTGLTRRSVDKALQRLTRKI